MSTTRQPERTRRGTGRVRAGSRRRRQILAAAIELFHSHGYHATGMSDIGAAVGLTGPALYRHFDSKAEILETALLRAADYMEKRVAERVAEGHDPRATLAALVADMVDVLLEYPAIVAIASSERRELSPRAQAIYDRSSRLRVTEWIGPLSHIRSDLSEAELRRLIEATHGLLQRAVHPVAGVPIEQAREVLFATAMGVLLGPLDRPLPDERPAATT